MSPLGQGCLLWDAGALRAGGCVPSQLEELGGREPREKTREDEAETRIVLQRARGDDDADVLTVQDGDGAEAAVPVPAARRRTVGRHARRGSHHR